MDPDEREATLGTFTSVTSCDPGTSRAILEHYKWDLDRAVDAFFDGSWQNALIDAKEAADLAASGASPGSPPVAALGGVQDLTAARTTTTIDDDDDDDDYVPSPPGFADADASAGGVVERGLGGDYHYVEDDDMEDQMLSAAVAASKDDARRFHLSGRDPSAPITLDDDDEDVQRAIRESVGGARADDRDHERDNRPPPAPPRALAFGGGSAHAEEQARAFEQFANTRRAARATQNHRAAAAAADARVVDSGDEEALPEGVTAAEREEARMLEAAMLGVPYKGPVPGEASASERSAFGGVSGVGLGSSAAPTAEVAEARAIRTDTDWAYEESLRLDREKEARRAREREAREREAAEAATRAAEEQAAREEAARAREAAIKTASDALPEEPAAGAEGVVDVAVKLPDGRRVRRRFMKTHPLQSVFNFLVVEDDTLEHGTYRLVSQFPRRQFEDNAEGAPTLEDAGLTAKQEALFVDLL